jgi:mono/diheme cytochrome c family protein
MVAVRNALGAVTAEQRQEVERLQVQTRQAGQLYSAGKYEESAEKLADVQQRLIALLASKDPAVHKLARPVYNSLERAHALLELEGVELDPLPAWEQLLRGMTGEPAPAEGVSFKGEIAPWLVSQCGNCHINRQQGQFSMATFNDLMKGSRGGRVVFPGGAKGSRLVEVIETGDMPRGNGKVSDEDFAKLQKWIDEGAKFDGPDPAAPMATYARGSNAAAAPEESMEPVLATGKETVHFATDIAPILIENCNGCHIAGRRPSGGFSMADFARLLRGGDSGRVVVPGKPDESLLVKKLKGLSGQRMPVGRPALSDEKIKLISTWIEEGATYDGGSTSLALESVVARAWAASASHEELLARRVERARGLWGKVLPDLDPSVVQGSEVIVLGDIAPNRAEEWAATAQVAMTKVRELLRVPAKEKLIKGGVTVFVYKKRYDYGEFGRMNENRQLPAYWQGHWRATPLDVYIAIVDDTRLETSQQVGMLIQQLAGAHVGALPEVPEWFAEGVARNVALATVDRNDPRPEQWKRSLPAAAALVDKSDTLLEGKLDDEAVGLIGMKLTGVMMDRKNRKRFDSLLEQLRSGKPFPTACTATFTPPDQFVKAWIGK